MAVLTLAMTSFALAGEKVIIKRAGDSKDVKVDLLEKKGAYIGIFMERLEKEDSGRLDYSKSNGVLIVEVVEDSPAEKAGFEADDIIYKFDGKKVEDQEHLLELLAEKSPGDMIDVVVYRNGDKKEYKLELGEQTKQYYTINVDDDDVYFGDEIGKRVAKIKMDLCKDEFGRAKKMARMRLSGDDDMVWFCEDRLFLGVRVEPLNDDLAGYFSMKGEEGVLVMEVFEDSAAEKGGIKSGDVIIQVADEKITDPGSLIEALSDFDDDAEKIDVTLVRKGKKMTLTFDTKEMESVDQAAYFPKDFGKWNDSFKHFKMKPFDDDQHFQVLKKEKLIELRELDELREELEMMKERLKKLEKEQD